MPADPSARFVKFEDYMARWHPKHARDATLETMRGAFHADPSDEPKWLGTVARPALALEGTYRELSEGWGVGREGRGAAHWLAVSSCSESKTAR